MKTIGHRGAKDEWPENTLLGISKAIESGVKGVEIDIQKSSDGKLMIIHDPTLERTTNGKGRVDNMSSDELRKLDAGQGEKIPFLLEVLELCKRKGAHLFIESKIIGVEKEILKVIEDLDAFTDCTVICFNHPFIKNIRALDSRLNTGCLIVGTPVDPVDMVQKANANLIAININTADHELVEQCHSAHIKVAVWNANTAEQVAYVKSIHADFIMTDLPSQIVPLV